MTLSNLWDSLLTILRKESKGLAVSPENFTDALVVENLTLFNDYYKAFEANQLVGDALRRFKTSVALALTYDGATRSVASTLPTNYRHQTGLFVYDDVYEDGTDLSTWTWVNNDEGYEFDTLTSSGANISVINGIGVSDCQTTNMSLAAGIYMLRVVVDDLAVSVDSDLLTLLVRSVSGTIYYQADLPVGTTYIPVNMATSGSLYMTLTLSTAEVCSFSINFKLVADEVDTTAIDIVTDEEWVIRRNDELTKPSVTYPIARFADSKVYVLPRDIDNVTLLYLKAPTAPYFDYYIDANLNIHSLAASQIYTLQAGEVYSDGTTSGVKTSQTVELEWDDLDQIKILHRILAKMGVSMDEQLIAQYALSQKDS